ncbi:MAG: GntR family transcriptional regulator [Clostridium sp.]|jgi:DNA-binding transcriptional regulator YhcF (GntR family)|nr:GntR family transcriptional regulator [Clostridium sp.]
MWELNNDRAIYTQLVERIQMDIVSGKYPPGEKLPSVRELAAIASVNPNTMQKAFSELERNGLIVTQRTSGRNVTDNLDRIAQSRQEMATEQLKLFFKTMKSLGYSDDEIIAFVARSAKSLAQETQR